MIKLGQTSYAIMLIAITVTMGISLVSFAIVFDSYVLDYEVPLPAADIDNTFSDIRNGEMWNSIVAQFQQLS